MTCSVCEVGYVIVQALRNTAALEQYGIYAYIQNTGLFIDLQVGSG